MGIANVVSRVFRKAVFRERTTGGSPDRDVVEFCMPPFIRGETDVSEWIKLGIQGFKEWYQPVDFGDGLVAHVTTPPDWRPKPELDPVRGMAKWGFILKMHIPDVSGKRILDLGCNNGVFSLQLARMGAREVIGIDRDRKIRQKSAPYLPVQNVIAQANFVKQAFEIKEGVKYPVRYIAHDIARISELDLGRFDLILALCVVYHELDNTPRLLQKLSTMTDHIVLQTCLEHDGELGKWASPYLLAELLVNVGFTRVEIDAPTNYSWPMIVGKH